MDGLTSTDLQGVLRFVEDAWAVAGEHPFPLETLQDLARLIPCDVIGYAELDRVARRELDYVGNDPDAGDDTFWEIVDEHPLCRHQLAYADFSAARLSDVISRRRLVNSRIYADWFRPAGIEAELEIGIVRSRVRTRNFVLDRTSGDFSDRDRAVLEIVRPHLARIYAMSELRRAVSDERSAVGEQDRVAGLTPRERDVLELAAAGLSNAAIAERMWISPGTVKKHLDNIYDKLGVANRTAAAALVGAGGPAPRL
jgi:DNA-binding CsgD family transcriptional regulator